ncbi:MAG: flagellar hook-basal body complex protein [Thermodesulfobacteriota bacterium]
MGLTSSMWTGVSGLSAHGEMMGVLGNNIANVNTIGFKGARMFFEDFISQDLNTAAGVGQVGRGVGISAIYGDFSQGAFETTNEATDLAIGGKGFFAVKVKGEEGVYYTRAGNFRFDKDGYLVDPHGYVLQGWEISTSTGSALASTSSGSSETTSTSKIKGTGVPKNIRLEGFTCQPKATQNVTMVTNLDARDGGDKSALTSDKFFSMFQIWDGQQDTPLGETRFAYQNSIKIYDEGGTSHTLTVYFDQVTVSDAGGNRYWEYMVTVSPSADGRTLGGQALNTTSAAGVLMIGTLKFDSGGQLRDMSAFTLQSGATGDLKALSNWQPADFNTDGQPVFTANFTVASNASFALASSASTIAINFGLANADPFTSGGWTNTTISNASMVGNSYSNIPGLQSPDPASLATTSYSGSSSTLYQTQDGYTFGFLQSVSVDRDGILTGRYSNGVVLELYQVTLYDFQNKWGLRREGSNLYSETLDSGVSVAGPANGNGYGSISSNSLEQSNVDLAAEFVKMISTERGFQANSKVITTTDNMLSTVIGMKR